MGGNNGVISNSIVHWDKNVFGVRIKCGLYALIDKKCPIAKRSCPGCAGHQALDPMRTKLNVRDELGEEEIDSLSVVPILRTVSYLCSGTIPGEQMTIRTSNSSPNSTIISP
jgi:hypothetical protein